MHKVWKKKSIFCVDGGSRIVALFHVCDGDACMHAEGAIKGNVWWWRVGGGAEKNDTGSSLNYMIKFQLGQQASSSG